MSKNKHFFKTFKELELSLEINKIQLNCMLFEKDELITSNPKSEKIPIIKDNIIIQISIINNQEREIERAKQKILKMQKSLNSMEYNVFVMHHLEKKTLKEIAEELQYSDVWIRKIHSKIQKKML